MASRVRPLLLLIAALAVVLVTAACGSHEGSSAGGTRAPANWGAPAPPSARVGTTAPTKTFEMFDDVTISLMPSDAFAVAGYNPPSSWPTYRDLARAFPKAHRISVAVSSNSTGECGDFEPGDMTPDEVGKWVRADQKAGFKMPCVYSSYYEYVNEIRPAMARDGIHRDRVLEFDADYTYHQHLDAGFDATQWTDKALGRSLDESTVTDKFLAEAVPAYVAPKPKPKPKPAACFGPGAQPKAKRCIAPVKTVTADQAHVKRLVALEAKRKCPTLAREETWFANHLKKHPHTKVAKRRAALKSIRARQRTGKCLALSATAERLQATITNLEKEYA